MRNIFEFLNDEERVHFISSYIKFHGIKNTNQAIFDILQRCKHKGSPEQVLLGAFDWADADCPFHYCISQKYWSDVHDVLVGKSWGDA